MFAVARRKRGGLRALDETHQFVVGLDNGMGRSGIELPVMHDQNALEEGIPVLIEIPGVDVDAAPVGGLHVTLGRMKLRERQLTISCTLKKPGHVHRARQIDEVLPAPETQADRY